LTNIGAVQIRWWDIGARDHAQAHHYFLEGVAEYLQTYLQTGFQAKQKEALSSFLMLVPGTGDDPVTSCFSDTRSTN
jgi:hypothetical protein